MLKLTAQSPASQPVWIAGGVVVHVRPATSFEVDQATASCTLLVSGLVAGEDAAMRASAALGPEFQVADFLKPEWREAAAQRIALVELATLCITGWEGIIGEDDQPLAPSREAVALLLRDSVAATRIRTVINGPVHQEIREKNVSAASPDGGAVMEGSGATTAAQVATAAPSADTPTTGSVARNTSTLP